MTKPRNAKYIGKNCLDSDNIFEVMCEYMPNAETLDKMTEREMKEYIEEIANSAGNELYRGIKKNLTPAVMKRWIREELDI